ncbi:VWA domain-containing protein [Patescibacteria group bacterium]|nr:VWA domain-containing protein [Patescibacteria group bacterium]
MKIGNFRMWAFWRRLQYGAGFSMMVALVTTGMYFGYFYQPPQCFDGVKNGNENGIDCGGACLRICAFEVMQPQVVWAKSFKIVDGQFNAVAYVENRNVSAASPMVEYTFKLMDGAILLAEKSGRTILPPGSTYPVFEGRISVPPGKVPTHTTLVIKPVEVWVPAVTGRQQFSTTDIALSGADASPRLRAVVQNSDITSARNVEVVATIFNAEGEPVTASQTVVDELPGQEGREVYFTWPQPIAKTVRSCEVPSDIMLVLDRSGSMAADGGTPPEPLESAKRAAQSFITLLQPRDIFGVVSYATTPSSPIEQVLTADRSAMSAAITKVEMGKGGTQYTNMGDAFTVALKELISERHREDARKVIVFLTDGDVTRPVNPETGKADREYAAQYAKAAASEAIAKDVVIYSIGFGDFLNAPSSEVARDTDLIKALASSPENYFEAPTVADLEAVYKKIASAICEVGPARIEVIPKSDTGFLPLQ